MDYKKKYEKYIQKILIVNNKIGGGEGTSLNKKEILNFFNRAKKTIIENEYDILFNMCLVKYGLRPSYLFELMNYKKENFDKIIPTIKNIYTEFNFTLDGDTRMFIHVRPLLKKRKKENYNKWIGRCLGFHCASSLIKPNKIQYSVSYALNIPNANPVFFYTEVCDEKKYDNNHFSNKLKLFDDFARKIGWKVEMQMSYQIPFSYYLYYLTNNKMTKEYENHLVQSLRGNGSVSLYENIAAGVYTFEDLLKDKRLLLFKILEAMYNPLEIFWPFKREISSILRENETQIFNSLTKDPIEMYEKYINTKIVKDLISEKPEQDVQHMNIIKHKLFRKYKKLNKILNESIV